MAKLLNDSSIATITSIPDSDYLISVDASTGELSKITATNAANQFSGGALIYAGLIFQSGTSNPIVTETVNTTGATFTATRTGVGTYELTCSITLFGAGLTLCFFNNSTAAAVGASRSDT